MSEPEAIPPHHIQWFEQLEKAGKSGNLALMSCIDLKTSERVSVICLVGWEGEEYHFTPIGHLCTADNPYDAYGPPDGIEKG